MAETFGLKDMLSIILLFGCLKIHVQGRVILSPGAVAPVCQLGDSLLLTCSTDGTILRWTFNVRNNQGRLQEYPRFISQDGTQQTQESEITVNSTAFTFMRTSAQGSSPLISTVVINSVNRELNGTVVSCEDVGTSTMASTTVFIFDSNFDSPRIISISEELRVSNVSVMMEWTLEEGVEYNISITPSAPVTVIGNVIVQLTLLYNTEYNVSLETFAACQREAPSIVQLFYAQCRNLQLAVANNSKPSVTYSDIRLIEGTMVDVICPPGLVLNGTMSVACARNGEWEPDPQDVKCIEAKCGHPMTDGLVKIVGFDGLMTDVGTTISLTCPPDQSLIGPNSITCTGNGEWEPDPSGVMCTQGVMAKSGSGPGINTVTVTLATSVAVLITSNIFLFILGCICGHYLCQKCKKLANRDTQSSHLQPVPFYENLQLKPTTVDEQKVDLEKNVAYGHFQRAQENTSSNF